MGQAIEGIGADSSKKDVQKIQSVLDGFFTDLGDFALIGNELALA